MRTTKTKTWCTIGLFALMSLGANAQTNLLLNGGFEGPIGANNLPQSWVNFQAQSAVNVSLETTNPYEGLNSLSLSYDPATNFDGSVQQTVGGIEAGSKYVVSYWYKYTTIVTGSTGGSALQWLNATNEDVSPIDADSGFFFGQEAEPTTANVFLPLSVTVTAPATATQLFINLTTLGATKNFIVDDVKIVKSGTLGINDFNKEKEDALNIYADGNTIYIATKGGERITAYNLSGQKIADVKGDYKVTVLRDLPANQLYVVLVDNKSSKVILK